MKKISIKQWLQSGMDKKDTRYFLPSFFLIICVIMFSSVVSDLRPEQMDLEVLAIAPKDIVSPVTVEDRGATHKLKQGAADSVQKQYKVNREYAMERGNLVNELFGTILKVKQATKKIEVEKSVDNEDQTNVDAEQNEEQKKVEFEDILLTEEERLNLLRKLIPENLYEELPIDIFKTLLQASPNDLQIAREVTVAEIYKVMNREIRVTDVNEARKEATNQIRFSSLDENIRGSMTEIINYAVIANSYYDSEKTELAKEEAIKSVEPVMIRMDQILVREGEEITRDIYDRLKLVGLVNQDNPTYQPYIGLALLILLLGGLITYYIRFLNNPFRSLQTYLLIYIIVFALMIVINLLISLIQKTHFYEIGYLVPIAMASMLIKMLINDRIAIITSFVFSVLGSMMFTGGIPGDFNYEIGVYFFISSLAGIIFLNRQNNWNKILQAGLFIALVNFIYFSSLVLIKVNQYTLMEYGIYSGYAILSGIISAVLTLGFLPFFEAGFGMLTKMKLIELSSPNHPLLRKILMETPGTYHHSVMVANLSEAACEAIGANGLLARVGAYYHDIGKTKRPHFFIENQMNMDNPHDKLAPRTSAEIIIAHPYDGAQLLKQFKMPKEIIAIAEQHHGTTLLKYFYYKEKEKDENVSEKDFRYPGSKAKTKEAAIVGIADCIEAAVRSKAKPTPNEIVNLVKAIISDRLKDGQFNESDLTLKELDIVATSFCETLNGIFHSRIEYPELTDKKVKEA